MREQFTFYRSFADAVKRIKKDADRAKAYDAICNYALYEVEPDLDNLPDAAAIAFALIKPNLDASKRKSDSGKSGGRPKANGKQNESKTKANEEQEQTANKKENKNKKEKENKCYYPLIPSFSDEPILQEAFDRWLRYKAERKEGYKEQGYNSLVTIIRKHVAQYGVGAVVDLMEESMASQWKGIIWEKLATKKDAPKSQQNRNSWMKNYA